MVEAITTATKLVHKSHSDKQTTQEKLPTPNSPVDLTPTKLTYQVKQKIADDL